MGNGTTHRLDDPRRPVVRVRAVPHGQRPAKWSPTTTMSGATEQDAYAARKPSQGGARDRRRLVHATRSCRFAIPQKKGAPLVVDRDEAIRADTTAEALAALRPAFKKDGTVTAGNAPGVNDGAAALVVMSARARASLGLRRMARIVGQATSGLRAEDRADDAGRSGAPSRRRRSAGRSRTSICSSSTRRSPCRRSRCIRELGIDAGEGQRPRRRRRTRPSRSARAARAC